MEQMQQAVLQQFSLFDFDGFTVESHDEQEPIRKKQIKWNPKSGRAKRQITMHEYDGFPDPDLVESLHLQIVNRCKSFRDPFSKFLEIVSYRKDFDWCDRTTYLVKIRVEGVLPFATALGVDLHHDPSKDGDQPMFFDYRHLQYEDHPTKPTIFGSVESKTEYLKWASQGI